MKKTIVKPDGTTEILEGTPEEIRELEKLIRGQNDVDESKGSNRRILNEEEVRKMIQEEVAKVPWFKIIEVPAPRVDPINPFSEPWLPSSPFKWTLWSDENSLYDGHITLS